jgi:nicotinamidase-related amidase
MPVDLAKLLDPVSCAVVTSECQNGVIGPESVLPELAKVCAETMIPNGARVCAAARAVGANVIHCIALHRPDMKGANHNARLFSAIERSPVKLLPGTSRAEVVAEFAPADTDLVLSRLHGLNPMTGTDLDPVLRNLGVTTIVVVGVSVNVAITNLVMDAVNRGYQVVLPRDAVTGVPPEYAETVIENTLSLLATVVTTDQILARWS